MVPNTFRTRRRALTPRGSIVVSVAATAWKSISFSSRIRSRETRACRSATITQRCSRTWLNQKVWTRRLRNAPTSARSFCFPFFPLHPSLAKQIGSLFQYESKTDCGHQRREPEWNYHNKGAAPAVETTVSKRQPSVRIRRWGGGADELSYQNRLSIPCTSSSLQLSRGETIQLPLTRVS